MEIVAQSALLSAQTLRPANSPAADRTGTRAYETPPASRNVRQADETEPASRRFPVDEIETSIRSLGQQDEPAGLSAAADEAQAPDDENGVGRREAPNTSDRPERPGTRLDITV